MPFRCWATGCGPCSSRQSGEHIVSQGLFSTNSVRVQGLPWCREAKDIGLASLTANILCADHNSQLSVADSEARAWQQAFRDAWDIAHGLQRRFAIPRRVETFDIDFGRFLRWCVKTLVNITLTSGLRIGLDGQVGIPPPWLVELTFGRGDVSRVTLAFTAVKNDLLPLGDDFAFAPILKDDEFVVGGLFQFVGMNMLLWIAPTPLPPSLSDIPGVDSRWKGAGLTPLLQRVEVKSGPYLAAVIRLNR